jgi:hypothetical protein
MNLYLWEPTDLGLENTTVDMDGQVVKVIITPESTYLIREENRVELFTWSPDGVNITLEAIASFSSEAIGEILKTFLFYAENFMEKVS